MITPSQSRAARGLIDLSQTDLAKAANLSLSTIADFERGKRDPTANNLAAIQRALEAAGVEFTNGAQPGVRMKAAIVFGVIAGEFGEPVLKGYDKDAVVIVNIDRGVFSDGGSSPARCEAAKAAIDRLNEIANRKYFEFRASGVKALVTKADIWLGRTGK
jgi:transcriptional regulator with XRE-family HTH domain